MFRRFTWLTALIVLAGPAAPFAAAEWHEMRIVSFNDFDDVKIMIDGRMETAYLIGLKPMHKTKASKAKIKMMRQLITNKFAKSRLGGVIFEKKDNKIGLLVDTFLHHRNDFKDTHLWDPNKYPWCGTGWGGYNFNIYFVYKRWAEYEPNCTDKTYIRMDYENLFKRVLAGDYVDPEKEKLD